MKVKLNQGMAGPEFCYKAGTVIDVDAKRAKELFAGGYAEPVNPLSEPQVADAPAADATAESPVVSVRRPGNRGPAPVVVAPSEDAAQPEADGEQSQEKASE